MTVVNISPFVFTRQATAQVTAQVTAQATEQVSEQVSDQACDQASGQVAKHVERNDRFAKILIYCRVPRSLKEIIDFIGMKHRTYFRREILNPLIKAKRIKMTIPEKPRSPKQKYYANRDDSRNHVGLVTQK